MRILHNLFAMLFFVAPTCANARPVVQHVEGGMTVTTQKKHSPVVDKAVEMMASDMAKSGKRTTMNNDIMVYQLDMASNKDLKVLAQMRVPAMDIITRKDAFWTGLRGKKTVVVGSNGRGTAYGLLTLARNGGASYRGESQVPSVEYRGISLMKNSGANYRQIFEMMLRHRANLVCEGWDQGEAPSHFAHNLRALADSFGIVLATPHGSHSLRLQGLKKSLSVDIGWADDNYGYMAPARNDPDDNCGAIYHLAHSGRPHSYLWLCTTQPGLLASEMGTAYDNGADRLWMCVVNNPYVASYQLSLFLDMAWNVKSVDRADTRPHLKSWLTQEFGQRVANALLDPLTQYFRLTAIRRPEMMDFTMQKTPSRHNHNGDGGVANTEFNAEEFGNELDRYICQYKAVAGKVASIRSMVAKGTQDRYFTMVEYPVEASALMAEKTLEAQESRLIARPVSFHHDSEALESAARSIMAYRKIKDLTRRYNEALKRLGQDFMMNDEPQGLAVFGKPSLTDGLSEQEISRYGNSPDDDEDYDDTTTPTPTKTFVSVASAFTSATCGARAIRMLGRSMNAVVMNRGDSVTYRFSSDATGGVLRLAFIPLHALDGGMTQADIRIDDGTPRTIIVSDGKRSERWMRDVVRGQALIELPVYLDSGSHTLTIKALNDHMALDEWMIDDDSSRQFYVFPIEPQRR